MQVSCRHTGCYSCTSIVSITDNDKILSSTIKPPPPPSSPAAEKDFESPPSASTEQPRLASTLRRSGSPHTSHKKSTTPTTPTEPTSPTASTMPLSEDEIDDLLYFARVGDAEDYKQLTEELCQREGLGGVELLPQVRDPHSGNGPLHMAAGNGHIGMSRSCPSYPPSSPSTVIQETEAAPPC